MKDKTTALAKRAMHGNADAFGELYTQFSDGMYRYALYHLGSREAAQDAVQEAALEAYKSIGKLRNASAAKSWFFGILYNICKHFQREKYKAELSPLDLCAELSSDTDSDGETLAIDLVRMISSLDEQSRAIVLLSIVGGYTSKEISEIAGIPSGTVRSRLSRTLTKLREELEG